MPSLERVFSVFLSPFESSLEEWQERSSTAFKDLMGADYSMYSEHVIGNISYQVVDSPPSGLEAMDALARDMVREEPMDPLIGRLMQLERTGQLPIYTTPLLDELLEGRFKETPFYRDLMEPAGMNHIAGLVSIGTTATRRVVAGWDRKQDVKIDDETHETLRMVYPVFDAACKLIDQGEMARRALLTTIDESTDGMTLVNPDGTPIHRNPSLRRLMTIEGESGALDDAITKAAGAASAGHLMQKISSGAPPGNARVQTRHGDYTVRACVLAPTPGVPTSAVLVTIHEAAQLPLAGEIQRSYGLTRRQAEVARLLAGRLSDAEIATRLGLSWHTVRSHVDKVFNALGVHSRQELIDQITGKNKG